MSRRACASLEPRLRPLDKDEIEQRIDSLAERLMADAAGPSAEVDPMRPRWISARDLVRRMRPFIVLN